MDRRQQGNYDGPSFASFIYRPTPKIETTLRNLAPSVACRATLTMGRCPSFKLFMTFGSPRRLRVFPSFPMKSSNGARSGTRMPLVILNTTIARLLLPNGLGRIFLNASLLLLLLGAISKSSYSLEQLESCRTRDETWNAMQNYLDRLGSYTTMHA